MGKIKFGEIDFSGDRSYIWGSGEYSAPERNVEFVSVQGRNGDLVIDHGNYKNISARYSVVIMGDVKKNTDRLKHLLYSQKGYQRLYDSERKGFYRMACFSKGYEMPRNKFGKMDIEFSCKPFWYDIFGDNKIDITEKTFITNKYIVPSRPVIKIYGTGDCLLIIGEQPINISNLDEYIVIDTEMQEAYKDNVNMNHIVDNMDVVIPMGKSEVFWVGNIENVEIIPRWVTL